MDLVKGNELVAAEEEVVHSGVHRAQLAVQMVEVVLAVEAHPSFGVMVVDSHGCRTHLVEVAVLPDLVVDQSLAEGTYSLVVGAGSSSKEVGFHHVVVERMMKMIHLLLMLWEVVHQTELLTMVVMLKL